MKGRSFLTLMDFSGEEIRFLLDLAHELKEKKRAFQAGTPWAPKPDSLLYGRPGKLLEGKNICLMFEKTSTRTRCSFEVATLDEGGHVTYLDPAGSQVGKKESIEDSGKVLGRFFDGIEYRGYDQKVVEDLALHSGVPVYNGLTDVDHPTQILADMMTMEEHLDKPLDRCKVVFAGDIRNNMSYAWMFGCAKMGVDFVAYGPKELAKELDEETLDRVRKVAEGTGAVIMVADNAGYMKTISGTKKDDQDPLIGADVIYTDVWASMGEEEQIPERVRLLTPYKVTEELLAATKNPDMIFMHCLPAFHDFETGLASRQKERGHDIREVTDEVFRGPHSVVFDEAENRMHSIKAVLVATQNRWE